MANSAFPGFVRDRSERLVRMYESCQPKYQKLWDCYRSQMPKCTTGACAKVANREGPQGIYWIGKAPLVFFVGKENYGWYSDNFEEKVCAFRPVEFTYYDVQSMSGYWRCIKRLVREVIDPEYDDKSCPEQLERVALTNACKCWCEYKLSQATLFDQCLGQNRFLQREIDVVNAPINVFFTASYRVVPRFIEGAKPIRSQGEFSLYKLGDKYLLETRHPGRASADWFHQLSVQIRDLKKKVS